ncbi:hypothetical protein [Segatella copri]|uniref:hypothetical protein n=1 Tax=Segatella copri TaxID=165179 RepID=UPI003460136F
MYNCEHNSPFFISNALPLLDKPGEWYHDIRTHKLYYMPRERGAYGCCGAGFGNVGEIRGNQRKMVDAVTFRNVNFEVTIMEPPFLQGTCTLQAECSLPKVKQTAP